MGAPLIDDELWALIEPLLPPPKPRRKKYPGRLPVSNRTALNGILFVFKTGIRWCDLWTKLGFGSGPTCWRRLRDWQGPACGARCTHCCSRSYASSANSISQERRSIHLRCEPLGRAKNWPEPHRSLATRFEASHPRRCHWRARQCHPDWRESQRRYPVAAAHRRYPAHSRRTRSTASQAQSHLRRSWIRL